MPKYKKETVKRILELIAADTYTITEICRMVGIGKRTYHYWMSEYSEFAAAVADAEEERMQRIAHEAKKSLIKKVTGYTIDETRTVTVPGKQKDESGRPIPVVKEHTVTKKYFPPDTAAIIFTLTNRDPDHWKNRMNTEVTGKDGRDLFAGLSDEELNARIRTLQKKLGRVSRNDTHRP